MPKAAKNFEDYYDEGDPNECWIFRGRPDKDGYGRFRQGKDGKDRRAHRVMLERKLGRPLKPGYWPLHTCDNPGCVNPAHLYEGTPKQNYADMVVRGRCRLGYRGGRKGWVTDAMKQEMMDLRKQGWSQQKIGDQFGCSQVRVSQILKAAGL